MGEKNGNFLSQAFFVKHAKQDYTDVSKGEEDNVQKEGHLYVILLQAKEWQNWFFQKIHEFSTWYDKINCLQLSGTAQTLLHITFK